MIIYIYIQNTDTNTTICAATTLNKDIYVAKNSKENA